MVSLPPNLLKGIAGVFALLWARARGKRAGHAEELREQAKQAAKDKDAERMFDLLKRKGKG